MPCSAVVFATVQASPIPTPYGRHATGKGTIESGEAPSEAALRELAEESGIDDAIVETDLGCWNAEHLDQIWSFQLCRALRDLPESWAHQTLDDHGHVFEFFWAPLDELPYADCHPVFQRALEFLWRRLKEFESLE